METVSLLIICGGLLALLIVFLISSKLQPAGSITQHKSVVFVTAHPDDECMFFGPTIVNLIHQNIEVHILCLSTGNFYGEGKTRVKELYASCKALGVDTNKCSTIDDTSLADGDAIWNKTQIQYYVAEYIQSHDISAVVTFDEGGVSGHPNHISIPVALSNSLPNSTLYKLTSVNIFRKYISFLDIIIALILGEEVCWPPWQLMTAPFVAMAKHKSQLMWFRYLYMIFSRYMIFNTFQQS